MQNKRGLSAIVTTLLIILLVLVAIGIVWGVVSGILNNAAEAAALRTTCLNINVDATAINCNGAEACVVTLTRTGSDTDAIGGVKFIFEDSTNEESSTVIDVEGNIEHLVGATVTKDSEVTSPSNLKVIVYLEDESGNEQSCSPVDFGIGGEIGGGGDNGGEDPPGGEDTFCGNLEVETPNDAGTGGPLNDGNEECDAEGVGVICGTIDATSCSCPSGYIADPESNDCVVNEELICGDGWQDGEQCDGGLGCVDCLCDEGYIPTDPATADCEEITYIKSGTIDNVWPPGSGMYFDDDELPKEEGLYYGKSVFFPTVDAINCFLIVDYSYDVLIYSNAIVKLNLISPLIISAGDAYQIWDEQAECVASL